MNYEDVDPGKILGRGEVQKASVFFGPIRRKIPT
jgi:hypothetical protein